MSLQYVFIRSGGAPGEKRQHCVRVVDSVVNYDKLGVA